MTLKRILIGLVCTRIIAGRHNPTQVQLWSDAQRVKEKNNEIRGSASDTRRTRAVSRVLRRIIVDRQVRINHSSQPIKKTK